MKCILHTIIYGIRFYVQSGVDHKIQLTAQPVRAENSVIVLLVPEGLVVEGVDAQDVQVAQKPRRDFAPAAARRTHCRQEEDVKKFQLCRVLLVVPVAVVDPLETIEIG